MEQQNEQQKETTGENTGRRAQAEAPPAVENQKQTRRRREVAENFTPPADSGVAADGSRKLAYTDDLGKKVQALASNIINKRKEREAINVEISKDFKVAKALGRAPSQDDWLELALMARQAETVEQALRLARATTGEESARWRAVAILIRSGWRQRQGAA